MDILSDVALAVDGLFGDDVEDWEFADLVDAALAARRGA